MAIYLSEDTVLSLTRPQPAAAPQPSYDSYAGVDAAVPQPAPYAPETPISDGLGHVWNSATQAWDNDNGTPYEEIQSYPQPALADYGGGFGGFAGQQVYETPDYQVPVPFDLGAARINSGQGQFYDKWVPTGTGYESLPNVGPIDPFPQQTIGPYEGDFDAGRNEFMDTLVSPARRLYEQGLDYEDPGLLDIARRPGQANPWDLAKPFDYLAELGADATPQIADTLGLGNAYRLGDRLLEASPFNPTGINPPDMPTSAQSRREVAGDFTDPGQALDEFNQRPWYEKLAAGAVFDPLNALGVGKADEAVDLARAAGRYGDDLGRGARRVGDEFGQAMGRSMQDVGEFTGLGPGFPVDPTDAGMVFRTGRKPGDVRRVVPESVGYRGALTPEQQAEQAKDWNAVVQARRAQDNQRAAAMESAYQQRWGAEDVPQPLARERLWFHSTNDLAFDLPDPDMAVGQATGITQGPGIYMAADPAKSAGNYGSRTFVSEFDGNVLDLTRPMRPDEPFWPGGPSWETIGGDIAERLGRYVRAIGVNPNVDFSPGYLDEAARLTRAELAKPNNSYAYRQSLEDLAEYAVNLERNAMKESLERMRQLGSTEDRFSQANLLGRMEPELAGRFRTVAAGDKRRVAQSIVANTLADNGVDAVFHHSPHADGDVLIVLNGAKARVVADVRNAPDAVKAGETLKDILQEARKAKQATRSRLTAHGPGDYSYRKGNTSMGIYQRPDGRWVAGPHPDQPFDTPQEVQGMLDGLFPPYQTSQTRTFGRAREAIARGEEGGFTPQPFVDAAQRANTRLFGDAAAREGRAVAGGIYDTIAPTEKAGKGLLRQYEGAQGTAGLELRKVMDEGNALLRQAGVRGSFDGTRFKVAANQAEVDDLYAALHGEGPVPPRLQNVYDYIKREVAVESQASEEAAQALGKEFIPNDDYFYRGWKSPKVTNAGGPNFGSTPGYQKPRVDATYRVLRAQGFEPASWNPIEMLALRRQAGVQWREQQELLAGLKETGQAMPLSQAKERGLDDWRVPQVGPAFEGKPRAYIPDVGTGNLAEATSRAAITYTDPIAVPNAIANTLEGIFGKRPDFGPGNLVLNAGQALKKNKLLASLFQQVDFGGRTLGALTASAVDELAEVAISMAKLHPVEATKHAYQAGRKLVKVPPTVAKLVASNVSGNYQKALRDEILSGKPILKSRPGISLRGISEAGGKFGEDITLVTRDIRKELRDAVAKGPPSWLGKAHDASTGRVTRNIGRINAAAQRGLFDGVYVVAQKTGAENFIVPRLVRQHADWTDQQIMAAAADELNKMYSTLGRYQTFIQNPILNELARGFIFSTNESEALLRGAASTVIGPNKRLWTEFYLGTFLSLAGSAALIHKASTGEWLPAERLNPISKDDYGPLPISYNSRFLAPDIPLKGRNGTRLSLDLVGQMDTAFRLLDPKSFIQSRENVLPRAATTQLSGKSFFGEDVKSPKDRLAAAASDLFEPIGVQQGRGVAGVGPGLAEGRIGKAGYAIQSAGLNVRGESSAMLRDRNAQEQYGRDWDKLEPFEKKAILDSDPSFKSELDTRKDEAFQQGQEWAEQSAAIDVKQKEYADRQVALDTKLEQGDLQPAAWREQRGDLIVEKRGAMDVLTAEFEPRKPEEQSALDRYFAQIDASKNGEEVDWGKVDGWLATQPAADQAFIERNLGLNRTPTEQKYKADVKAIADSGYWDVGDMAAEIWGQKLGIEVKTQSDLETAMREGYTAALEDAGLNAAQARIKAGQLIDQKLGDMYEKVQEVHKKMRKDPELMRRLVTWGYYTPGKESMGDALRSVAGGD